MIEKNISSGQSLIKIKGYIGLSVGCYLGSGYGLTFGFGTPFYYKFGLCTVIPSRNVFFHSGYISGCFIGLTLGTGINTGITCIFGMEDYSEAIIDKILHLKTFINESKKKVFNHFDQKSNLIC